jgi:hypothetical protein
LYEQKEKNPPKKYLKNKKNVIVNAAQGTWRVKSRDEERMLQYRLAGEVWDVKNVRNAF